MADIINRKPFTFEYVYFRGNIKIENLGVIHMASSILSFLTDSLIMLHSVFIIGTIKLCFLSDYFPIQGQHIYY
jgi:hypothetical protein